MCESVSSCKKSVILSVYSLDKLVWESHHQTGHTHFWSCPSQKFSITFYLICMNLCQYSKNQLISSVHGWDTVNFRVKRSYWPHPFLTTPYGKVFDQLLICVNLYQHAKNEVILSICSGEKVDLKILKSDWLRAFWSISQKQDFSHYRICAGTQQII